LVLQTLALLPRALEFETDLVCFLLLLPQFLTSPVGVLPRPLEFVLGFFGFLVDSSLKNFDLILECLHLLGL
jgi:hypothetical protein